MPEVLAPKRVVCFRTDRIGDLVLAMPAMAALAAAKPGLEITVVAADRAADVVTGQPWAKEIIRWDHGQSVRALLASLRPRSFDASISFFPHFRISLATALARIPLRIGTAYRWHSPLFNRRVGLHRAGNAMHEAEYNGGLLEPLGVTPGVNLPVVAPVITEEASAAAGTILAKRSLKGPFVVIHPGSGGSALNAGPALYGRIGRTLERSGREVVFTGTEGESGRLREACAEAEVDADRVVIPADLGVLAALVSRAAGFVGPSTGPMHIAASLGTPTVALFPPVHSQSPVRWGPRGPRTAVIMPDVARTGDPCPACREEACDNWNCMDAVKPEEVLAALERLAGVDAAP